MVPTSLTRMHGPGHHHAPLDADVLRSREGVRAVVTSLAILLATAGLQVGVFILSGSIALLADLIHNVGDALTAVPVGIAFAIKSKRAEQYSGIAVVLAILISGLIAGYEAVQRLLHPHDPDHLLVLAAAGLIGWAGNRWVAVIRLRAGREIDSAALVADGEHARADAWVSLGVVGSAAVVAIGLPIADPIIGLVITAGIMRITWQSWKTVQDDIKSNGAVESHHDHDHGHDHPHSHSHSH